MLKSILVAADGSEYTEPVMNYAVQFAKMFDAKLRIVTVVDIRIFEWSVYLGMDGFAPVLPSSEYLTQSRHLLEKKAEKVLEKCVQMAKSNNASFTAEQVEGSPREIIDQKSHVVDLVMLGSRGEFAKWGSSKIMGATMEAISRECIKPLFISPKEFRPIKKILAPYDGSLNSNRALPYAGYLASNFGGEITVLTIDKNLDLARSISEEGKIYFDPYDVALKSEIRNGNPDDQILNFAEQEEFDCIVMGAYGHSRIIEAILGSITQSVMKNAKIPILLVK